MKAVGMTTTEHVPSAEGIIPLSRIRHRR